MDEPAQLTDAEIEYVLEHHGTFGILELRRDGRIETERAIAVLERWDRKNTPLWKRIVMALVDTFFGP